MEVKKMGIKVPQVARGINPHENIRQSALTLDGPAISNAVYAHDIVIADAINNGPGFNHLPSGANLAGTGTALKAYVEARGGSLTETGANAIAPALAFLRDRLYVIMHGREQTEMPLITDSGVTGGIDASHDSALKLRDCYVTGLVILGVAAADVSNILLGGSLCVFVNDTTGAVSIGASGACPAGSHSYELSGTLIVKASTYTNNAGTEYATVDFIC